MCRQTKISTYETRSVCRSMNLDVSRFLGVDLCVGGERGLRPITAQHAVRAGLSKTRLHPSLLSVSWTYQQLQAGM